MLFDGAWEEHDRGLRSTDPLQFTDTKPYRKRLETTIAATGMNDAVITATGNIHGVRCSVAAMEYGFIGGSMGVVVGEKITRAIERAIVERIAGHHRVVLGRRPDDGRGAVADADGEDQRRAGAARPRAAALLSVLTDPTTGGVTASFAMLGDVNIAEPKALIGFAGPRVIEQTIRQKLPEGFQRSEFLLERGMLDMIVDRREMKDTIGRLLRFGGGGERRVRLTCRRSAWRRRGSDDRRVDRRSARLAARASSCSA